MRVTRRLSFLIALVIIGLFFVFGGALLYLSDGRSSVSDSGGADNGGGSIPQPVSNKGDSTFILENFHRSETKEGRKQWEVFATRGEYAPSTQSAKVYGVRLNFYREEEGSLVELRSQVATLFLNGNELVKAELGEVQVDPKAVVEDRSVEVDYGGNVKVTTPRAIYDGGAGVITSEGPAVFENKSFKTTGKNMHVDVRRRIIRLNNEVNSIFYSKQ